MRWGFGRAAAQQKQLPVPQAQQGDALKAAFARAVFGTKCRTLSFRHPEMDKGRASFCKAMEMPDGTWSVFEHKEELAANETALVRPRKLAQGLAFFAAIEKLYEFENGQKQIGFVSCGPNPEKIPHFQAFAEREGIIFDINDKPHPTHEGEVVTEGVFTQEALDRARAFYRHQPEELARISHENAAVFTAPAGADGPAQLDKILASQKNVAALRAFINELDKHIAELELLLKNNFEFGNIVIGYSYKKANELEFFPYWFKRNPVTVNVDFRSFFQFTSLGNYSETAKEFLQKLALTERVLHAKGAYARQAAGQKLYYDDDCCLKKAKDAFLADLGSAQKNWEAAARFIMDGQPLEMPEFIAPFRKQLGEKLAQLEKSLEMDQRRAAQLPAPGGKERALS